MIINVVELLNHLKLNLNVYFHLVMFNYEMWTNPICRLVDRLSY